MIKSRFAVKQLAVLASLVAVPGTSSFAQSHHVKMLGKSCHETTLKVNIYSGGIIRTNDGYAFQIDKFGQFNSEFWSADDELLVCAIKKSVDGRVVTTYTLKDSYFPWVSPDGEHAKLISGPGSK